MSEPRYTEREWRERMERGKYEQERRIEIEETRALEDRLYGHYEYVGTDHDAVWVPPSAYSWEYPPE